MRNSDVNPGKEQYKAWDPEKSADRRAKFQQYNQHAKVDEPARWNGVR